MKHSKSNMVNTYLHQVEGEAVMMVAVAAAAASFATSE